MNKTHTYILLVLFGMIFFPKNFYAQKLGDPVTDDLGDVSDAFQENFFEALKQKGIENYELAINALQKAEKEAKGNKEYEAAVDFEMGKNLFQLKKYHEAEIFFSKVIAWDPNRLEVLEALYDVYFEQKNYEAAIPVVLNLVKHDSDYKEDLANLYNRTHQYEKALKLLDELDKEWGESNYRNVLRSQIYRVTGNTSKVISNLEEKIDKNPKSEKEYLNLIYLYSEQGDTKKAFKTAKELLKQKPKSQLVHLALYKYFLEENNKEEAINSMKIVFASQQIEQKSKNKVLEDFLNFSKNKPEYKAEIKKITPILIKEDNNIVFLLLGDYYLSVGEQDEALQYYLQGVEINSENYGLLKNTLLLQIELKKYQETKFLSEQGLEIFPAQPLLYLINGVANNNLNNSDLAIDALETGLDYIFDDPQMEYDFYLQLAIAYSEKGKQKKANYYNKKASELSITNQKTAN